MRKVEQISPEARAQPASSVLSRQLLLSLYLPALALSLGTGIATPVIPLFAKSFGVDFGAASLVVILTGFGSLAATLPAGYLMDRIGRRPILLAGPLLTALSAFLIASAHTFPELLVYRFIGGAAAQMWQQSRVTIITDTGAARSRGRQITWMMAMQRVGNLVSPAIGGFLAAGFGLRAPFLVYGALSLLAFVPTYLLVKESTPRRLDRRAADEGAISEWRTVINALRTRQISCYMAAQFLANIARGQAAGSGVVLLYAAYAYDIGPSTLGLLSASNSAIGLPIGFTSGYLMDRFGRKVTIVPGFAGIFVSTLITAATAAFHAPFALFVPAFLLMNGCQSVTGGNLQVLASDLAPAQARGRFFAISRLMSAGGAAFSPVAFSAASSLGYGASFGVRALAALAVSLIIGFGVGETVGRDAQESAPAATRGDALLAKTSASSVADAASPR
ncbi:MAG TPA: MFS transporter [Chloroflexota bacterium]|nr:MFS transporter [Chloroflexota bacterium]